MGFFLRNELTAVILFLAIARSIQASNAPGKVISSTFGDLKEKTQGKCVMYDVCDQSKFAGNYSCVYDGPPKKLKAGDSPGLEDLRAICPELVEKYGDEFCCSSAQIETLQTNLGMPNAIIGRCPSCYYNFRQIFCELACGPFQAQYLNVTKSIDSTWKPGNKVRHFFFEL